MLDRLGKVILVVILSLAVALGGYLGYYRYLIELQDRTVELCVDLGDLKKIANYEKKPLGSVLKEVRKKGITSIGLFEETLPDAAALGELYYAKGSGIIQIREYYPYFFPLLKHGKIKPERSYVYIPSDQVRKRVYEQLKWTLGKRNIRFHGKYILEINEDEKEIRELGIGISEAQKAYLIKEGFRVIPRVWNDPRFHFGNVGLKIGSLKAYDTIIFDGEEILGYPKALDYLAQAMKKNKIRYGYIEIVKQDGDVLLRRLMGREVVRVHSVPKNELEKLNKAEVVKRFVRAAREREVRFFYIRPFLPPQVDAYPVAYNLDYFGKVKRSLEKAGFVIGRAEKIPLFQVQDWQLVVLGLGVMVGALFLINHFFRVHSLILLLLLILGGAGMYYAGNGGLGSLLQPGLALLTAIVFPSLAVISSFSRKQRIGSFPQHAIFMVINILAETLVGVFLLIGILADYRFMLGVETFRGVKIALVLPVMLVALYFILQQGSGSLRDRIRAFLNTEVKMLSLLLGVFMLAGLAVFVARSGNFILPVPAFEKHFRNLLEMLLFIRPRTKEFMVGYPLLFLASVYFLRGKTKWLWVLAALGTIAPISVMNTFSHIHTPLSISLMRTINGLVLGMVVGLLVALVADRFMKRGG